MKQFLEALRKTLDTDNLDDFGKLMAIDCLVEMEEEKYAETAEH